MSQVMPDQKEKGSFHPKKPALRESHTLRRSRKGSKDTMSGIHSIGLASLHSYRSSSGQVAPLKTFQDLANRAIRPNEPTWIDSCCPVNVQFVVKDKHLNTSFKHVRATPLLKFELVRQASQAAPAHSRQFLKFLENKYHEFYSIRHIRANQLGYLFIFLAGLVLTYMDESSFETRELHFNILSLIAAPILCLFFSLVATRPFSKLWRVINTLLMLILYANASLNYWHIDWNDTVQASTESVAICCELLMLVAFPSIVLKLGVFLSSGINIVAFITFILYARLSDRLPSDVVMSAAVTLAITIIVMTGLAYHTEFDARIAFLEEMKRIEETRKIRSELDTLAAMRHHRMVSHADPDDQQTTEELLHNGQIVQLLGMVFHSDDPALQEQAANELNNFIDTQLDNIDACTPVVQNAISGLSNIRQWLNNLHLVEHSELKQVKTSINVFLGGSCNPTTWRADIAMPMLDAAQVTYYNPQVDDWSEALVAIEARAKEEANILLFVIDEMTRALASIVEATEYICSGRAVVIVLEKIGAGTSIAGEALSEREIKDLNRSRSYLAELARRHGTAVKGSVEEGIEYVIELVRTKYINVEDLISHEATEDVRTDIEDGTTSLVTPNDGVGKLAKSREGKSPKEETDIVSNSSHNGNSSNPAEQIKAQISTLTIDTTNGATSFGKRTDNLILTPGRRNSLQEMAQQIEELKASLEKKGQQPARRGSWSHRPSQNIRLQPLNQIDRNMTHRSFQVKDIPLTRRKDFRNLHWATGIPLSATPPSLSTRIQK